MLSQVIQANGLSALLTTTGVDTSSGGTVTNATITIAIGYYNSQTLTSVSDNKNNIFPTASYNVELANANSWQMQVFVLPNANVGSNHVFSAGFSSSTACAMLIAINSNRANSSVIDVGNNVIDTNFVQSHAGPNITTLSTQDDLLEFCISSNSGDVYTNGTGFTISSQANGNCALMVQHSDNVAINTYAGTFTTTQYAQTMSVLLALRSSNSSPVNAIMIPTHQLYINSYSNTAQSLFSINVASQEIDISSSNNDINFSIPKNSISISIPSVNVSFIQNVTTNIYNFTINSIANVFTQISPHIPFINSNKRFGPLAFFDGIVKVSGNKLVNGAGQVIQLRGTNISDLESVAMQGWDSADPWGGAAPNFTAIKSWNFNSIRLPLNECSWLAYSANTSDNVTRNGDPGGNYKQTVANTVQQALANNLYVILDLHWTAPNSFAALAQQPMADTDHSNAFWVSVANYFKGNNGVIFEVFNEPYISSGGPWSSNSNSWSLWLNGGSANHFQAVANDNSTQTYTAYNWTFAGVNSLINSIRSTGANNVVLVGGLQYSNDLTGVANGAFVPTDNVSQMAFSWHTYSNNPYVDFSSNTTSTVEMLSGVGNNYPLVITEFGGSIGSGASTTFPTAVMNFVDSRNWGAFAWTWNAWNQDNTLIQNNTSYTPTLGFGQVVYNWTYNHS